AATESNARAAVLRASADGRAGGERSVESENDQTTLVTSQPVARRRSRQVGDCMRTTF
ncbi:hypothetical protein MRX96_024771, partial [Rhipicephalus microplus]